jgi:hypothetical protein
MAKYIVQSTVWQDFFHRADLALGGIWLVDANTGPAVMATGEAWNM